MKNKDSHNNIFVMSKYILYLWKSKEYIFKNNSVHSMKVSGVQNNIEPNSLQLYEKKKKNTGIEAE